jgi:effector-binding domain-containing protein
MRIIKRIVAWIATVIILLLIISFFLKRKVYIEGSVIINTPTEVIFEEVNTLKNWEKWSPWHQKDPNMTIVYEGPESGVKAKFSWESKNTKLGKGILIITDVKPNELIAMELKFGNLKPAVTAFAFEKNEKGTKVTWSINIDMGKNNPIGKYKSLFVEKRVGKDIEKGLASLKEIVEKKPKKTSDEAMKVIPTTVNQQDLLMVHIKCSEKEISKNLGEAYGKISAYAAKNNTHQNNAPLAIYYHWENDAFDFDAAIPVDKKVPGVDEIKAGEIKAGNAVMVNYYGPYEGTGKAHNLIKDWLKSNNKKASGAPWEVYLTDPGTEKDTAKWLTRVYYPVE